MIHLVYFAMLLVSLVLASLLSAYFALSPVCDLGAGSQSNAPDTTRRLEADQKNFRVVNTAEQQLGDLVDDIGNIGPALACGRKKCLFPIVSKQLLTHNGMEKGYLISKGDARRYERSCDAWSYAKYLEHSYGISQTLLDKPIRKYVSEEFVTNHLNADTSRMTYKNRTRRFEAGFLTFQPVRILPQPSILIGCYSKYEKSIGKLEHFISEVKNVAKEGGRDITKEQFITTLVHDLNHAETIMKQDEVQCLYHDFQVMVNASGNLHHIDLDRCLPQIKRRIEGSGTISSEVKAQCIQDMHQFVDEIRKQWHGPER